MNPNQAVMDLAQLITAEVKGASALDEFETMVFLDFIIKLLPVLAELLQGRCVEPIAAALRTAFKNPFFNWRYKSAVRQRIGDKDQYQAWGAQAVDSIKGVLSNEANDATVTAAMKAKPAPVWGLFGAAV